MTPGPAAPFQADRRPVSQEWLAQVKQANAPSAGRMQRRVIDDRLVEVRRRLPR
jgi:hypothetical protein